MPAPRHRSVQLHPEQTPTNKKLPRTWPIGRVCSTDGCGTVLSRYNGKRKCWSCTATKPKRDSLRSLMEEPSTWAA